MKKVLLAALLALFAAASAFPQATPVAPSPLPALQFLSSTGAPLASGCLYTFISGSNSPLATFTDGTGVTQNSNPIQFDAGGFANVWLSNSSYRFQIWSFGSGALGSNCGNGTLQRTVDNVSAYTAINQAQALFLSGQTSDPGGSAGELIYRSDIPCFRAFTTFWDCLVRLTDVQTLTNKTLTAPVINGTTTGTGVQGSDAKLLSAGTISASSGVTLCTDANGGATTSNCGAGVAKFDQLNNTASINSTTLYAVPSTGAGTYRLTCFAVITQAATTSSTLPGCSMNWTDQDTGAVIGGNVTTGSTVNTVGTYTPVIAAAIQAMEVKASTNITFNFTGYASSGATPMAYAVHVKLEYLGQ